MQNDASHKKTPYKYAGFPLTPLMALELIVELFSGQTVEKQELSEIIELEHLERGGKPIRSKSNPATRALTLLKQSGRAENPLPGVWTIFAED